MSDTTTPTVQPLGDAGLLLSWGQDINKEINAKVIALAKALRDKPFSGMLDCIAAYSSLVVLYDLSITHQQKGQLACSYDWVKKYVLKLLHTLKKIENDKSNIVEIPVCYDESLSNDLTIISDRIKIAKEEIISLHASKSYHVYMAGFMPGFVYMGEVDKRIAVPRKSKPTAVKPGSVGIAGVQTGIYPSHSPGGWHIVGFTPVKLFHADHEDDPCLLHPGDTVQFVAISIQDYKEMLKEMNA